VRVVGHRSAHGGQPISLTRRCRRFGPRLDTMVHDPLPSSPWGPRRGQHGGADRCAPQASQRELAGRGAHRGALASAQPARLRRHLLAVVASRASSPGARHAQGDPHRRGITSSSASSRSSPRGATFDPSGPRFRSTTPPRQQRVTECSAIRPACRSSRGARSPARPRAHRRTANVFEAGACGATASPAAARSSSAPRRAPAGLRGVSLDKVQDHLGAMVAPRLGLIRSDASVGGALDRAHPHRSGDRHSRAIIRVGERARAQRPAEVAGLLAGAQQAL